MAQHLVIDEVDRGLIDALQVAPRASWTRIGDVLDLDPTTAARRWKRLTDRGYAWQVAYPGTHHIVNGMLELECDGSRLDAVTDELESWPSIVSIDSVAGEFDLWLTVAAQTHAALSQLVSRVSGIAGVRRTRTRLVLRSFGDAATWNLSSLAPDQRSLLTSPSGRPTKLDLDKDRGLLDLLYHQPRCALGVIAAHTGHSVSSVRRRLHLLLASGELVIRVEVAQLMAGAKYALIVRLDVPADDLVRVGVALGALAQTRNVIAVTGRGNLAVHVWLAEAEGALAFERELQRFSPGARILERSVILRSRKRMGRILDAHGLPEAIVSPDFWTLRAAPS